MKTIELKNVTHNNLKNINFTINKGDFIVINDTNENLEKTFFNLVSLIEFPTYGCTIFDNVIMNSCTRKELKYFKNKLSIVFNFFELQNDLTIYENILFFTDDKKQTVYFLNKFGLSRKFNYYPYELNETEKQKALLIVSMIKDHDVLIIDNFDYYSNANKKELLKIIKDEIKNDKIVIVSSKNEEVIKSATKPIKITENKILINKEGDKNVKKKNANKRCTKKTKKSKKRV